MTNFKKHEESMDVQIQMKILDKEGHEVTGVIEYDPNSGWGKRIIDADKGLVQEWYCQGGTVEIDGNSFNSTNQDPDKIDAVKTLVNMKVNRNKDPKTYEDLLTAYINNNRAKSKAQQQALKNSPIDTLAAVKHDATAAGQNVSNT